MFPNQCGAGMDCSACMGNEISRLKERIQELESQARWIPVSERLPIEEKDMGKDCYRIETVIVHYYGKTDGCEFVAGNTIDFWSGFKAEGVTHWMPLPEPPKEAQ